MSTTTHSTALDARANARHAESTFGHGLLQAVAKIARRIRANIEERRVRQHLATLPDSLLRDIGIAEHEIHRIRACERFTPRAWVERMGNSAGRFVA